MSLVRVAREWRVGSASIAISPKEPQEPQVVASLRMPLQWTPTCPKSICLPNSYRGDIRHYRHRMNCHLPAFSGLTRCLRSTGKRSKVFCSPFLTGWTGRLAFPPDTTTPRDNARLTASASPSPRHIGSAPGRKTSLGLSKATNATVRKQSLPCLKTRYRRVLHRELQLPRVGAGNEMCSSLSSTATSRRRSPSTAAAGPSRTRQRRPFRTEDFGARRAGPAGRHQIRPVDAAVFLWADVLICHVLSFTNRAMAGGSLSFHPWPHLRQPWSTTNSSSCPAKGSAYGSPIPPFPTGNKPPS